MLRRLIFVGPPGSGKGTQAPRIKEEFRLSHLSTGDMLRDAVAKGTELGRRAEQAMDRGQLVGDDLVAGIVGDAIKGPGCSPHGFILDGFPRTVQQAAELDRLLAEVGAAIHCVVNLLVPDDRLVRRITGRRIHPPSGRSYNIYFNPPKEEGKDDVTGEPLVTRGDDTEEKLRSRLEEFHSKTKPVLQHYAHCAVDVDADEEDLDVITARIRDALRAVQHKKRHLLLAKQA